MAWHFEESESDFVSVANHAALTFPDGDWALSLWVKLESNAGAATQYVMSWGAYAAMPSFSLFIYEAASAVPNRIKTGLRDDDGTWINWIPAGTYGTSRIWQHWLVMRDTANNLFRTFIDGAEDPAAGKADTNFDAITWGDVGLPMLFGKKTAATDYFDGDLAEAAFWSGWKPSASQIAELVSGKSPIWFSNNLAWWIPMLDNFKEDIAGLTITNPDNRVEISAHPPQIIYPPGLARIIFLTGAV